MKFVKQLLQNAAIAAGFQQFLLQLRHSQKEAVDPSSQ
jgi:hypothetical protein